MSAVASSLAATRKRTSPAPGLADLDTPQADFAALIVYYGLGTTAEERLRLLRGPRPAGTGVRKSLLGSKAAFGLPTGDQVCCPSRPDFERTVSVKLLHYDSGDAILSAIHERNLHFLHWNRMSLIGRDDGYRRFLPISMGQARALSQSSLCPRDFEIETTPASS